MDNLAIINGRQVRYDACSDVPLMGKRVALRRAKELYSNMEYIGTGYIICANGCFGRVEGEVYFFKHKTGVYRKAGNAYSRGCRGSLSKHLKL